MGITSIGFTGLKKSKLSSEVDICIKATSNETNHIQEMHIAIGQLICGIVEETMFVK